MAARTLVLRFSEAIHDATMAGLTLTLTPDPGNHTQALDDDGRTLRVSFEQPIPAATPTTLHLDGLRDRTGNTILPFDTTFTLTDSQAYAVLADTSAPSITAVVDTAAGLVLSFDEPVTTPAGTPIEGAVTLTRSGLPVGGTTTRLTETALAWTPTEPASWQPGGEYRLTALTLQDLHSQSSPVQTAPLPLTITHLATQPTDALLAYTAPTDSAPLAASAYGQTALFQGREWHADLGMYYYRARWATPGIGFMERDPVGYFDSPNLTQSGLFDPFNTTDPLGLTVVTLPDGSVILFDDETGDTSIFPTARVRREPLVLRRDLVKVGRLDPRTADAVMESLGFGDEIGSGVVRQIAPRIAGAHYATDIGVVYMGIMLMPIAAEAAGAAWLELAVHASVRTPRLVLTGLLVLNAANEIAAPGSGASSAPFVASVWTKGAGRRGVLIEDLIEAIGWRKGRTPPSYPGIDFEAGGVVTSVKSVDLAAKTYQKAAKLSRTLRRYVDKLVEFKGAAFNGRPILPGDIMGRELALAIPRRQLNAAQRLALEEAKQYAESRGVQMHIFTVD